jgi:hypothetical protein
MKGVVPSCLGEMVGKRYGDSAWQQVLETAGLSANTYFRPQEDVDDATVMRLLQSMCAVLGLGRMAAAEAFGEHWCCEFAPRIYRSYYVGCANAKEFLLRMGQVHEQVTRAHPLARPPMFTYEDPAPDRLIMNYESHRSMGDIFVGLVKGVGRYFHEDLKVRRLHQATVEITFAAE